jgi:Flagellar P-ring protein
VRKSSRDAPTTGAAFLFPAPDLHNLASISLLLRDADFANAERIALCINAEFGRPVATATDSRRIEIASATQLFSDPAQLAAHLQSQRASSGAEEFKASLFASVLEKMEKNLSIEDEQNNDAGHDTWGALGVRAVSQALAQRHVLGIAGIIEHSLGFPFAASSPVPENPASGSSGENKSGVSLKISLKSSGALPMSTPEGVKGAL